MGTCSVDGCESPVKVKSRGLCGRHYSRLMRHGDPTAWHRRPRSVCSVEDCDLKCAASGMCDLHYRRMKRYGTVDPPSRPTSCTVEGCDRGVDALGMCDLHYRRTRRVGEPEPTRRCRQCGGSIEGLNLSRVFCSNQCAERWNYWERRRTHREVWLKRYGLTVADYEAMLAKQAGLCAICRGSEPRTNGGKHWCVDHDHVTGAVRGLLCQDCNVALGKFRDNPALLRAAANYLEGGDP